MLIKDTAQNIQLVNEKNTPEEAFEMIDTLVEDRIRFHKIQMLRKWERNHRFDSVPHDQKIVELRAQRTSTKAFIAQAEREGYDVEITTNIEVRLVKKSPLNTVSLELTDN